MLSFAGPGLHESIRVHRLPLDAWYSNEIRLSHTVQVLYTRKLANFLKAQRAFLCRFHHVLVKASSRKKCSIRRGSVTRIESGLPPDVRSDSEIRLSYAVHLLYTRKLANFLNAQTASLCRFHQSFFLNKMVSYRGASQGYPNRFGSTAGCPK